MKEYVVAFTNIVELAQQTKCSDLRKMLRKQVAEEEKKAKKLLGDNVRFRTEFIEGTRNFRAVWRAI